MEKAYYLREKGYAEEVMMIYQQLSQNLEEFVGKMFNEWGSSVDKDLKRHLEVPLMCKSSSRYIYMYIIIMHSNFFVFF